MSHILFSKVFSKANQVQCYWCWDITELSLSWFAHARTHIHLHGSVQSSQLHFSSKTKAFFISKTDLLNVTATVKMICYTNTHLPASFFLPLRNQLTAPSWKRSEISCIQESPGLPPWPDTHDSHNLPSDHVIQRLQMLHSVRLSLPPTPAHGWEAI